MKKQVILICVCFATLDVASGATWQPSTHECSLEFPGDGWTLKEGGAINHGQMLLAAMNQDQTKSVNVLRFQVAPSMSVKDARFVNGLKKGFTDTGSRLLRDGYTNLNGRTAYWFTGAKHVKEQQIATLNYSLCENGALYQLVEESIGAPPLVDDELVAILASFRLHLESSSAPKPVSAGDSIAYQVGRITGFLLVLILGFGIVTKLRRKRSGTGNGGTGK